MELKTCQMICLTGTTSDNRFVCFAQTGLIHTFCDDIVCVICACVMYLEYEISDYYSFCLCSAIYHMHIYNSTTERLVTIYGTIHISLLHYSLTYSLSYLRYTYLLTHSLTHLGNGRGHAFRIHVYHTLSINSYRAVIVAETGIRSKQLASSYSCLALDYL
jgi:hypothetical protein